jgi:hypothetical protein
MYKTLLLILKTYWRDYGGFREWVASPFLHAAIVITGLYGLGVISFDWRALASSSLPTMLGFSLAAYTITFTLMGSALHRALSSAIDKDSGTPLIRIVNATFFHIVLFQSLALFNAVATQGSFFWEKLGGLPGFGSFRSFVLGITFHGGNLLGCFLITYSILLLFSVGFAMFRLGRLSTTVPPPSTRVSANDDGAASEPAPPPAITKTWRFAIVRFVARALRLYD